MKLQKVLTILVKDFSVPIHSLVDMCNLSHSMPDLKALGKGMGGAYSIVTT